MSPHDLQLLLYELPREDISFGRGAGTESWYFGRCPRAGPGDVRERRYSYKRGIKCQPTLALLLLGD